MNKHERLIEKNKLLHDTFKHLTTLSSASILLVSAFLVKSEMKYLGLAVLSMSLFLVCNVISILAMFMISATDYEEGTHFIHKLVFASYILSLASFNIGLFAVARFAWLNF